MQYLYAYQPTICPWRWVNGIQTENKKLDMHHLSLAMIVYSEITQGTFSGHIKTNFMQTYTIKWGLKKYILSYYFFVGFVQNPAKFEKHSANLGPICKSRFEPQFAWVVPKHGENKQYKFLLFYIRPVLKFNHIATVQFKVKTPLVAYLHAY